jgi:hypothetical protein
MMMLLLVSDALVCLCICILMTRHDAVSAVWVDLGILLYGFAAYVCVHVCMYRCMYSWRDDALDCLSLYIYTMLLIVSARDGAAVCLFVSANAPAY